MKMLPGAFFIYIFKSVGFKNLEINTSTLKSNILAAERSWKLGIFGPQFLAFNFPWIKTATKSQQEKKGKPVFVFENLEINALTLKSNILAFGKPWKLE